MRDQSAGDRQRPQQPDEKQVSMPCLHYSQKTAERFVGPSVVGAPSFVSSIWTRLIRAVSAILAISILLLLSADPITTSPVRDWFVDLEPPQHVFSLSTRAAASSLLEVFQVYPPVLTVTPDEVLEITDGSSNATVKVVDSDRPTCQEVLATYSFALSYGKPFVGVYTPPSCSFNRVTWNLTVVSAGKQFDRLGIVYLGDVEVFRTSTAEPTTDGIGWTYLKDMTSFLPLFKTQQKLIFDLGNLINDVYTAPFNVTLTASYFTAEDSISPADLVLPISAHNASQNMPSVFMVPPNQASNVLTLPQNIQRAVLTIAATGQSEEEFWWSNVLQSNTDTYPETGLYGYSPFREVQLLIDGMLAGVVWPFPVIFTGGVVPGLWRPIVGIDTFDLKEDEIDITPWLPLLCDGKPHNFTILVSGLNDDGNGNTMLSEMTGSYWLVTGKIFVWLDEDGHITTGTGPNKHTPAPMLEASSSVTKTPNGTNGTLLYDVNARRTLSFESTINFSHGTKIASWRQSLTYSNNGNFSDGGNVQINNQHTQGYDISSLGYVKSYNYPLYAYSTYSEHGDNITIEATVERGKDVTAIGDPVFPTGLESFGAAAAMQARFPEFQGARLSTTQNGRATYLSNQTAQTSYSSGTTEQDFTFRGVRLGVSTDLHDIPAIKSSDELFHRYARAVNGTVVEDDETLLGTPIGHVYGSNQHGGERDFCLSNVPGSGGAMRAHGEHHNA